MSSFNSGRSDDDFADSYENLKPGTKQSYSENPENSPHMRTHEELNLSSLQRMNATAEQNLKTGNIISALENYERCLDYLIEAVAGDPSHPTFVEYFRETLKKLNDQALKLLREDKIEMSQMILEKCEEFTNACCYRRVGKLDIALKYLHQALEFVASDERMETAGITHINLCAILSQMNNHQKALEHAKKAVYECSFEIIKAANKSEKNQNEYSKKVTTLAIAYHNLGVEEDFCGNVEGAKEAYYKAYEMIERANGPNDPLVKKFKAAYTDVKNKFMQIVRRKHSPTRTKQTAVESKPARPLSAYKSTGTRNVSSLPNPKNTITRAPNPASKIYFAHNRIVIQGKNEPQANMRQSAMDFHTRKSSTGSIKKEALNINNANQFNNVKLTRPQTANVKGRRQITVDETPKNRNYMDIDAVIRTHPNKNFLLKSPDEDHFGGGRHGFPDSDAKDREFMSNIEQNHRSALQKNFHNSETNARKSNTPSSVDLQISNIQLPMRVSPNPQIAGQQNQAIKPRIRRFRNAPSSTNMSVEKKTHLAAIKIQKRIRGYLVRKKYRNALRQKRFIMLYFAIDKLALDPEDPHDTFNYYVFVWYDLFDERMIFNVRKQLNKRDRYSVKVKSPLPEDTTVKLFANSIKALAVAKVQAMYIEGNQLKFKMVKEEKKGQRPIKVTQQKQPTPQNLIPEEIVQIVTPKAHEISKSDTFTGNSKPSSDRETNPRSQPDLPDPEPIKTITVQIPTQKPQIPAKKLTTIQALVRGRLSRAVYYFLNGGLYHVRDALSFRHQGHWLNARILQKYLRGRRVDRNPKEFVVVMNDWTDCVNFNLTTVPASHFLGNDVKVRDLKDSFQINLFTHELQYQPVKNTSISYQIGSKKLSEPKIKAPAIIVTQSNLGFDDKTVRLILKVQKVMRGHLWRKKYNFFDLKYYKVLFSKSFLRDKHIINIRIMERIYKTDAPKTPEKIVTAHDFTDKVRYNVLPYNLKALGDGNPSELALDFVLSKIAFNLKTHIMKYQGPEESRGKEKPTAVKDEKPEFSSKKSEESQKKSSRSKEEIPKEKALSSTSKKEEKNAEEEPAEEMPDLNDPGVQQSTLAIQKAYLKKKNKEKRAEEAKKEIEKLKQKFSKYDYGKKPEEAEPKSQEKTDPKGNSEQKEAKEDEEMPDLNDPEVQNSAMLIQKAYLKKKNKQKQQQQTQETAPQTKERPKSALTKEPKVEKHAPALDTKAEEDQKEELPDLNDPEIQQSTLAIQKAYLKKKSKAKEAEERKKELEALKEQYAQYGMSKKNQEEGTKTKDAPKNKEEAEEMPDLNDPEVQQSTLAIQKAYLKKKNKAKEAEERKKELERMKAEFEKYDFPKDKSQESATNPQQVQQKESEQKLAEGSDEEMPDLNDPGVQQSTLMIQKAYLKKKNKEVEAAQRKAELEKMRKEFEKYNYGNKEETPQKPNQKAESKKEEAEEELPDLNDPGVQQSAMIIQKAYLRKKNKQPQGEKDAGKKSEEIPKKSEETKVEQLPKSEDKQFQSQPQAQSRKEEEEEEMPDLNDPEVQNSAMLIQKAYLKKKNRAKSKDQKDEEKKGLPELNPKQKETEGQSKDVKQEKSASQGDKKNEKVEDNDEPLPDLNDPEIQQSTLAIQRAYLRKKTKEKLKKENEQKSKEDTQKKIEKETEKETKQGDEEKEEMPDLNDPGVQQSTLAIQKAYLKRKNREKEKAERSKKAAELKEQYSKYVAEKKESELKKQENASKPKENNEMKKGAEEEEEMPDLNDPEVQNSAMLIQKAYLKKKNKQQAQAKTPEKKTEPERPIDSSPKQKEAAAKKEDEENEELPDLNDPEVQNSAMLIQKAYLRKKNKQKTQTGAPEKKTEPENPAAFLNNIKEKEATKEKVEEEEMPDLNDPEVQNSAMLIQKAYLKKKDKQKQQQQTQDTTPQTKERPKSALTKEPKVEKHAPALDTKAEEDQKEELPDLNDPEIQQSTLAIQKAYLKKKSKAKEAEERKKELEALKRQYAQYGMSKKNQEEGTKTKDAPKNKEEEEEMPDLNDPEVQQSTLAIQKAYLKKKKRAKEAEERMKEYERMKKESKKYDFPQVKSKETHTNPQQVQQKEREQRPAEESDEEMPNLNDPGVQQSTLMIQKAYLKKKNREKEKAERKKELEELKQQNSKYGEEKKEREPKAQENVNKPQNIADIKKGAEEEEEMPDLNDPEVQNSAMLIQKAYLRKKNKAKQGSKGEVNRTPSGNIKKSGSGVKEMKEEQKEPIQKKKTIDDDGDDEMPDLNDPEIQKSTLLIQQAYLNKKNKQNQAQGGVQKPFVGMKFESFGDLDKREEEEQLPEF